MDDGAVHVHVHVVREACEVTEKHTNSHNAIMKLKRNDAEREKNTVRAKWTTSTCSHSYHTL